MARPAIRRPDGVEVTYRRMRFDFESEGFERYWHGGSPFISFFWAALSAAFPAGEKFFIDSARALRKSVDDPELDHEIAEFCRQEGHHTYHHVKFNQKVAEQGLDMRRCEGRFEAELARARERLDALGMLAATVALEHFTAGFAHQYLSNPRLSRDADPKVRALWAWHAAEEAEHKATCYDLYRSAGGGYLRRVLIMPGTWMMLLGIALVNTFTLLRQDKQLGNFRDLLRGMRYLFGWHGLVTRMVPSFFAFMRPRFHPWKDDDSHLIRRWQAENARYITATPGMSEAPPAPAPAG